MLQARCILDSARWSCITSCPYPTHPGTPPTELLAKMKKRSQHMDFNFPSKVTSSPPQLDKVLV